MTRIHRSALFGSLILGSALLTGCLELFKPAQPTPPVVSGGSMLVTRDYSDPDRTLHTMALAMANKNQGNGADAWVGAFADPATDAGATVEFVFDAAVLQAAGLQDPDWNLVSESRFYSFMCVYRTQPYYLEWTSWDPGGDDDTNVADGTAYRPRKYRLYTVDENGNTSGLVAIGVARLYFERTTTSRWAVIRWIDTIAPDADPNNVDQECFSKRRLSSR